MQKKLPKSINPNGIKDCLIQFFYKSELPQEVLVGYFHQALKDEFELPKSFNELNQILFGTIPVNLQQQQDLIFQNEEIKVQIGFFLKVLTFNCNKEYIGWDKYFAAIDRVLSKIEGLKLFSEYNRLGIRYITEFKEEKVSDIMTLGVTAPFVTGTFVKADYRWEMEIDPFKVAIKISDNIPRDTPALGNSTYTSIVDIDVIKTDFSITSHTEILDLLKKGREIGKAAYFQILKESYVETLNPKY